MNEEQILSNKDLIDPYDLSIQPHLQLHSGSVVSTDIGMIAQLISEAMPCWTLYDSEGLEFIETVVELDEDMFPLTVIARPEGSYRGGYIAIDSRWDMFRIRAVVEWQNESLGGSAVLSDGAL